MKVKAKKINSDEVIEGELFLSKNGKLFVLTGNEIEFYGSGTCISFLESFEIDKDSITYLR